MTAVKIHSPAEIEMARAAGQTAAKVLEMILCPCRGHNG